MLELRDAHCYGHKTSTMDPVGVRDVVLVHDESKPRGFWKLSRVRDLVVSWTRNAWRSFCSAPYSISTLWRYDIRLQMRKGEARGYV